jgi:hypothetical protein
MVQTILTRTVLRYDAVVSTARIEGNIGSYILGIQGVIQCCTKEKVES